MAHGSRMAGGPARAPVGHKSRKNWLEHNPARAPVGHKEPTAKPQKKPVSQFFSAIVSKHILIFMKTYLFYYQET